MSIGFYLVFGQIYNPTAGSIEICNLAITIVSRIANAHTLCCRIINPPERVPVQWRCPPSNRRRTTASDAGQSLEWSIATEHAQGGRFGRFRGYRQSFRFFPPWRKTAGDTRRCSSLCRANATNRSRRGLYRSSPIHCRSLRQAGKCCCRC